MIIAASDHIITKEDEFVRVIKDSLSLVDKNDILLTLGITPSRPDTGYGYIQYTSDKVDNHKNIRKVYRVGFSCSFISGLYFDSLKSKRIFCVIFVLGNNRTTWHKDS